MPIATYFLFFGLLVFAYGIKHCGASRTFTGTNAKAAYGLFGGALVVVVASIFLFVGSSADQRMRVLHLLWQLIYPFCLVPFVWWLMRKNEKEEHLRKLQKATQKAMRVASIAWHIECTYLHIDGMKYRITSEDGTQSFVVDPTGHPNAEMFQDFHAGTALAFELTRTPEKIREYDYFSHLRVQVAAQQAA